MCKGPDVRGRDGRDVGSGSEWGRGRTMERCREETGRERRLWAGRADLARPRTASMGSGRGLEKGRRGAAVTWWYHVLAVGRGSLSASQGGLGDQREARLPADRYLLLAQPYSRAISGTVGEGDPQECQGPCLPPGFLGAPPQPQESPPPPCPPGMFGEKSAPWSGGRLGASPGSGTLQAGRLCGEQSRQASGASGKGDDVGSLFLGRPTNPQTSILSPTHGPTPIPSCRRGSLLPPPSSRPLARRVSPPHNHIWFSLGSQDASARGPPLLGEVGRRIRGD